MANASAKRIAIQNENAVKNLRVGMLVSLTLSLVLRLIFRRHSLPPSKTLAFLFVGTLVPEVLLYRYLVNIGTTKRDPAGNLVSSGEDLNQSGITEWCFDIVYITWLCQVGSAIVGERFWLLYLLIPGYAMYRVWSLFVSPMLSGRSEAASEGDTPAEPVSKRQQKLKARSEKGDPRVKTTPVKRY